LLTRVSGYLLLTQIFDITSLTLIKEASSFAFLKQSINDRSPKSQNIAPQKRVFEYYIIQPNRRILHTSVVIVYDYFPEIAPLTLVTTISLLGDTLFEKF
jgi:hypothetical protein